MAMLELRGLTKNFGGLAAVQGITFGVEAGTVKALIGPNGAGKTTTFNMITGLYHLDGGQVCFKGERIDGLRPHTISAKGLVRTFQKVKLFRGMTVLENAMVGQHCRSTAGTVEALLRPRRVRQEETRILERSLMALEMVGIADQAYKMAHNLPFGQQRLLEIARALAAEPQMVLLDEPAAGLNAAETGDLAQIIRRIRDIGTTVLLVEHDMSFVMSISDEIVVLNFGKKLAEGTPEQIQNDPEVRRAYLGGGFR